MSATYHTTIKCYPLSYELRTKNYFKLQPDHLHFKIWNPGWGGVAQWVEHLTGIYEVVGSSLASGDREVWQLLILCDQQDGSVGKALGPKADNPEKAN